MKPASTCLPLPARPPSQQLGLRDLSASQPFPSLLACCCKPAALPCNRAGSQSWRHPVLACWLRSTGSRGLRCCVSVAWTSVRCAWWSTSTGTCRCVTQLGVQGGGAEGQGARVHVRAMLWRLEGASCPCVQYTGWAAHSAWAKPRGNCCQFEPGADACIVAVREGAGCSHGCCLTAVG